MRRIRLAVVAFLTATLTLGMTGSASADVKPDGPPPANTATQASTGGASIANWEICHPFVDIGPLRWSEQYGLYYQTMLVQITGCGGAYIQMHEEYVVIGDHGSTELVRKRWPSWGDKYCTNANSCTVNGSHTQFLTASQYARLTEACVTGTFFVTRAGETDQGSVRDCNPWSGFAD